MGKNGIKGVNLGQEFAGREVCLNCVFVCICSSVDRRERKRREERGERGRGGTRDKRERDGRLDVSCVGGKTELSWAEWPELAREGQSDKVRMTGLRVWKLCSSFHFNLPILR